MSSVTELLHTKYPLVQAPMNWATDARFVAAVANAGALGVLGPNAGLSEMVHGSAPTSASCKPSWTKCAP